MVLVLHWFELANTSSNTSGGQ